ncbi:MAG: phage holin family protein [Muribaculaceae bacterium]|nr:phage holin family protein [Muribaculaceae bacterium]
MHDDKTTNTGFKTLWEQLRMLFDLEVDSAKLIITEKLTLLVTSITFYAVSFVLCTCAVVFLSIAAANLLRPAIGNYWSYVIIAGFYLILTICVCAFKRRLIIDPVARFLSSVILDPPTNNDDAKK